MKSIVSLTSLLFAVTISSSNNRNAATAFESIHSTRFTFQSIHNRQPIQHPSILPTSNPHPPTRFTNYALLASKNDNFLDNNDNDSDDEVYTPSSQSLDELSATTTTTNQNYLDDLTPPPVNFARNSILFSENPSTKTRNNPPLELWKFCRNTLPAVVTGAWPWRDVPTMDERPLAALYNAVLVRLPVIAVAISYLYQKIAEGHDLVMDLGFDSNGPQVVPPVLVIATLVLILL